MWSDVCWIWMNEPWWSRWTERCCLMTEDLSWWPRTSMPKTVGNCFGLLYCICVCIYIFKWAYPHSLGLLPVVSVGVNQVGRLNLGRHADSLQFFTVCGQQEGYRPFAANMARDPALWMSWRQPQFVSIQPDDPNFQVNLNVERATLWGRRQLMMLLNMWIKLN